MLFIAAEAVGERIPFIGCTDRCFSDSFAPCSSLAASKSKTITLTCEPSLAGPARSNPPADAAVSFTCTLQFESRSGSRAFVAH